MDPRFEGILRYRNKARKVGGNRVRIPRRSRTSRKSRLTESQRKKAKDERAERKKALQDALKAARNQMWELAKDMRKQFGGHDAEWYYRAILQQRRLNPKKRELSMWNAFVSQELKKHNEGSYPDEHDVRTY